MPEKFFNNRYRLMAELGRGGMSVVYRAHDILLDRGIAVKVLSSSTLGDEGKNRLMHEARAAARLNHPNIIQVYDAGEYEGQAFIVMQLLEGKSLYKHKPASLDEILAITRQVCQALAHAHAHGVIHRDLKPENVIISSEGVATLTDFGLARSVVSRVSFEGAIVGTVSYLSPEQALGQAIDGRTDLYALGVMLYELVCHRMPFDAEDPLAVIAQHLYAPVVPPSTYVPQFPQALDALIVKLMSKRPEDRPASALDVLAVLDTFPSPLTPGLLQHGRWSDEGISLSPLDRLARGRLIGRERELAEAKTIWKRALAGEAQVLLISGEPGVGKTPLVRAIIALAEVSAGRAFVGECFPEGSAPFAPIAQVIRTALDEPRLSLSGLIMADLLTLAPDLRDRLAETPAGQAMNLTGEQQRLLESVFSLCAALAAQAPLLFVVEDIQWADRGTLSLLRYLARRARSSSCRLLIVLTYRESELNEAVELNNLLIDLNRERLAERIKLSRFNRQQTGDILAVMFQEQVSSEFLEAIYTETEGNLFFIEELCKTLIEEEKLTLENGHWRWPSLQEIELPQSVRMTIQARISRLPETAQEVLRLAAILGREFDFGTLHRAAGQDEETIINALEMAERAQLIAEARSKTPSHAQVSRQPGTGFLTSGPSASRSRPGQVSFAFAHALIPVTLRESLPSLRRYRLHRKAANAIEALHPQDYAALAYHYDRAGDEECARDYYRRAGEQALSVYANQDAIHFYTETLSLYDPDDPARFAVLSARARAYDLTAQRQAQLGDAQAMLEIAEKSGEDSLLCDALFALSDVYLHIDYKLAREPAARAVSISRSMGDTVRKGFALRNLGEEAWRSDNFAESRALLEEAAGLFQGAGMPGQASGCLNMLSLVLGFQGLGEIAASQQAAEQALALSRQAGDRRQEGTSLRRLAIVYMDQFRHAEALPYARAALDLHQEIGDRGEAERALNVLGLIMGWLGRDAEAERYFLDSLEIAESARSSEGITNAMINLSWIFYVKRCEYEAGLRFLDNLLSRVRKFENVLLDAAILGQKAEMLASLGQVKQALEMNQHIRSSVGKKVSPTQRANLLAVSGVLLAELGDHAGAFHALESAYELAERVGRSLEEAAVLSAWAMVDLLEGSDASLREGLGRVERSISILSTTNWKFDLGYALRLAAELHLALGEKERALSRSEETMALVAGFPLPMERFELVHAQALRMAGRLEDAGEHLRLAYERVMQVAQNLQDPVLRQSWLQNVRTNRTILSDAAQQGTFR